MITAIFCACQDSNVIVVSTKANIYIHLADRNWINVNKSIDFFNSEVKHHAEKDPREPIY